MSTRRDEFQIAQRVKRGNLGLRVPDGINLHGYFTSRTLSTRPGNRICCIKAV